MLSAEHIAKRISHGSYTTCKNFNALDKALLFQLDYTLSTLDTATQNINLRQGKDFRGTIIIKTYRLLALEAHELAAGRTLYLLNVWIPVIDEP